MSHRSDFTDRHIGPNQYQIQTMLLELGFKDLDSFIKSVVPNNIHIKGEIEKAIPSAISETAALAEISEIAKKNSIKKNFIGSGYYGTITPAVILRNVLENPGWYTAYTPYQPEIAQGRLEAIFAFQTAVTDLTGLDIANASMLDEATATAEAMTLARRVWQGSDEAAFVIDTNLHPHVKAVVHTRAKPLKIKVIEIDFSSTDFAGDIFAAVIAYPNSTGEVKDISKIIASVQSKSALVIVNCDLLALTLFKTPGEYGADIAVGSAQRFGVPVGYGGPHAGFLAVRTGLERSLPGRLVGQSVDTHGNLAFRLALQTREQHIRRDKATSNICTAQVLLAVIAAFYTMWHGPQGLKAIASRVQGFAYNFRGALRSSGFDVANYEIFDTVLINTEKARQIFDKAAQSGFNIRLVSNNSLSVSFDEQSTENDLSQLLTIFGSKLDSSEIPASNLARKTDFLSHPIFNTYHSETAMLRHIRTLSDRDLALDRTMIPLGSCTMKLNATSEMIPITWPEFNSIHPFGPADQAAGYTQLIKLLSDWLISITGYDAVSLQPNAGSQGEFAGLLAIRNYLDSKGESARDICLIPSSAHGTNAASAVMAGMKVIVIACDENGNVSLEDLKLKITQYRSTLAALMVTYPSTHGVFESAISQICEMIHEAGGQVYVDGANLNALVGVAKPGKFGADVSHLNLHKTFCIPHGGGGPGVGPVIARKHLAPFLPNHPANSSAGPTTGPGPVSGAPFGSASILPISWMYIRMMGGAGLTKATEVAILSANYIAKKIERLFPVLYKGQNGFIAHECIIDIRELTKNTGVTVDDIAKRLMDHGFHSPTVSFPVAGTMMIEPTESEDVRELDRFLSAMESIRAEIAEVEAKQVSIEDSPLRHAPHTIGDLVRNDWDRKYSRLIGAFPNGESFGMGRGGKYLPTVGRIDGVYGDRNLVCSCLPIEELASN
ncbi:glycine dehydrogenase [Candidatus Nanopelagicus hibericus]|uniref:Glycine dehydrogenase (decarboxylating) n=1 Tax=Candidatus Nanopelagicus hibericus TaxID=1884915 RepID=A0A249K992_9ACTN|nr:aminomethyl-transferring glycine dehydrogenase [Candidatus Nanopelagicus hibericus]ASY13344.1 glycine dehydrogenase [Candidatus Nanopelagicus hibericus]